MKKLLLSFLISIIPAISLAGTSTPRNWTLETRLGNRAANTCGHQLLVEPENSNQRILLKNVLFSPWTHVQMYFHSNDGSTNVKKITPKMFFEAGVGMNTLQGSELLVMTAPGDNLEVYFDKDPNCDMMIEYTFINN